MKSKHLLGVISIFTGFGLTGYDVLTGERYPMSPGNYEVPQTQQLQRGWNYFLNEAPQQSTVVLMRQEVSFNWKE